MPSTTPRATPADLQAAYVGNSLGGLLTGQEGVRGQVVLAHSGISGIPIVNVENACASAATALRGAWLEIASGAVNVALAVGVEKMNVGNSARTIGALSAVSELDLSEMGMQFTTSYAIHPKINLKAKMRDYGWTIRDFAKPAVKNSHNGSLNPLAQHRRRLSIEEVVQSRIVVDPLTLLMCSSISDGAAAAVLCASDHAARFTSKKPIQIASCVLRSGEYRLVNDTRPDSATTTAFAAYEQAAVGPEEIEAIELHDAMAPAELILYERLGLCGPGEGPRLIDDRSPRSAADSPSTRAADFAHAVIRWGRPGCCSSASWSGRCAEKPERARSSRGRKSPWRKIRADCCWVRIGGVRNDDPQDVQLSRARGSSWD